MEISYDPDADAVYIRLTDEQLMPGRDSVSLATPVGVEADVVMDWREGKIVGLEVLDAAVVLHADLLATAVRPGESP
jgi:uncharacterized protein YuzE